MIQTGLPDKTKHGFILEKNQRFSSSLLWKLQRNFFERRGIEAWRQGIVPQYITSNTFIAEAYAKVVLGFLKDCQAVKEPLDLSQPIYIIELGAGSGRFAFHFLKKFLKLLNSSTMRDISVRYVMTDFTNKTIDYWQEHPGLKSFVERGYLDFAQFDVVNDRGLRLINSRETLSPATVRNSLVVIANYFFDSIPQDIFYIKDKHLYENLISITSSKPEDDLTAPEMLNRIEITYEQRPVSGDYYNDFTCNNILREYQQQLRDTFLSFPYMAIDCIHNLSKLSDGHLLLLTADKGYNQKVDLQDRGQPGITIHGSFSTMVNYHALGKYIMNKGGQVLHTTHRHNSLDVSAFILGKTAGKLVETFHAYNMAIDQFGPDNFFTLKKGVEKTYDILTVPQIISYLSLSGWDTNIFLGCFPTLLKQAEYLSEAERRNLYDVVWRVWDIYYPIGEDCDLAFSIGMLFYGMAYYSDAQVYFHESLRMYGTDPCTLYNISMCYYCLGQLDSALTHINKAIELKPTFEAAKGMRTKIQTEIDMKEEYLQNYGYYLNLIKKSKSHT